MNKLFDYLNLKEIGLLELFIAFYPIMSEYSVAGFPLSILYLFLIFIIAYRKPKLGQDIKKMIPLFIYVGLHELLWMIFFGTLSNLHILISIVFTIFATYYIAPRIDFKKLNGSLNWVALLSIAGLLYHILKIYQGNIVRPIFLPFMPAQAFDSRFFEEGTRPVSFFVEPSSYATFMLYPLFYALINNKYIWAAVIIFTQLLSTSTNAIIFSAIIVLFFIISTKLGLYKKILLTIIACIFGVLLLNTDIFEASTKKIEETEYSEYSRIINGPQMCLHVPKSDLILGIPDTNLFHYYKAGGFSNARLDTGRYNDNLFVPTLWSMLLKYGFIGLLLFLNLYIDLMRRDKILVPFVIMLLISFCVQSTLFNPVFVVQILVLFALFNYRQNEKKT